MCVYAEGQNSCDMGKYERSRGLPSTAHRCGGESRPEGPGVYATRSFSNKKTKEEKNDAKYLNFLNEFLIGEVYVRVLTCKEGKRSREWVLGSLGISD